MPTLTLKITGTTKIGGKAPGQQFDVACHEDGWPVDVYWFRRIDEAVKNPHERFLAIVSATGVTEPAFPVPFPSAA